MSKLGAQSTYNVLYYKYETKRKRHLFICNNCLFRLEITSMKEKFTKEQIEQMLNTSTEKNVENSVDLVDECGNVHNIDEVITQAENDVKKKYPKVNFKDIWEGYNKRVAFIDDDNEYYNYLDKYYRPANYYDVYKDNPELMTCYAVVDIVIMLEYLEKSLPVL